MFAALPGLLSRVMSINSLLKQTRNAPGDVATLRDSLRMMRLPVAMCKSLGVRHGFAGAMAPALKL